MESAAAQTIVDYGPDTPEEIEIKRRLVNLQRLYADEAHPLLTRLSEIRALKNPRILYVHPANCDLSPQLQSLIAPLTREPT